MATSFHQPCSPARPPVLQLLRNVRAVKFAMLGEGRPFDVVEFATRLAVVCGHQSVTVRTAIGERPPPPHPHTPTPSW